MHALLFIFDKKIALILGEIIIILYVITKNNALYCQNTQTDTRILINDGVL